MAAGDGRYVSIAEVKAEIPDSILKWATYGVDNPDTLPATWTIDETKIAQAIAFAEGDVDSKVSKRYRVPLDLEALKEEAAREIIKQAALLLAVHKLYCRVGHGDEVRSKIAQALTRLDAIAKGDIELPGAEAQARKRIYYDAPERVFGSPASKRTGNVT